MIQDRQGFVKRRVRYLHRADDSTKEVGEGGVR